MKEIIVKTQADYDAIKDQETLTTIKILSAPDTPLIIERFPKNCIIMCGASSSPSIECGDSSSPSIECGASSSPSIECWDSSSPSIECWASSSPSIECGDSSSPSIESYQFSVVRMQNSPKVKVKTHQKSIVQYIPGSMKFKSVAAWLKYWELKPVDGKVTLFKAVHPDGTDFHSGKVLYAVGSSVICPDWRDDWGSECGYGLHCSPHVWLTHRYCQDPHVHRAMDVDVADIRLPSGGVMEMPDKIRVKRVQNVRVVEEAY